MPAPLTVNLSINGANPQPISVSDATEPLLYVLRNQVGLHGPKFGCGVAQCGACTVEVNGSITRSCVTSMSALPDGAQVNTLESLGSGGLEHRSGQNGKVDVFRVKAGLALQRAFVQQQAAQCGYCANAMVMGAYLFLKSRIESGNTAIPTSIEIQNFLTGIGQTPAYIYLCRCGTHLRIVRAIQQAARDLV